MTNTIQAELITEVLRLSTGEYDTPCTRTRWRKYSTYSEHAVKRAFVTHTNLLIAAGLQEGREIRKFTNKSAAIVAETRVSDYVKAEILPWASTSGERDSDHVVMVVGSDFHGEHSDPFALDVFLDVIRRTKPDHVVLNGDVAEFEEVGKWASPPNRLGNLQHEIDWVVNNILIPVREAAGPDCEIDLVIGNHEYRLIRYLADSCPGLASLRCLGFADLFQLARLDIGLVFGASLIDVAATEKVRRDSFKDNFKVYYDSFLVTHGTATGHYPASKELDRFRLSGTSGHIHVHQTYHKPTIDRPYAEWNTTSKMARHSVGDIYMRGLPNHWSTGFGVVNIFPEDKTSFFQHVIKKEGKMMFDGVLYREEDAGR